MHFRNQKEDGKRQQIIQRIVKFYKFNYVKLVHYFLYCVLLLVHSYTGVGVNSILNLPDFPEWHLSLDFMSLATNLDIQQKSKREKCTFWNPSTKYLPSSKNETCWTLASNSRQYIPINYLLDFWNVPRVMYSSWRAVTVYIHVMFVCNPVRYFEFTGSDSISCQHHTYS